MGVYHFSVFRKQFQETQMTAIHIQAYVNKKDNPRPNVS
jgi:hypothetical protein